MPPDLLDLFDIDLSPSQRLLTLDIAGTALVPHRLVGEERVSAPFTYTLDCISQQGDIELKTLMAQPARLSILQSSDLLAQELLAPIEMPPASATTQGGD